ncbi:MAG: hypothetical protein ACFCUE_13675 [Candidatus Bathyarchaeia archaeon]|jgi:hypothetical protein
MRKELKKLTIACLIVGLFLSIIACVPLVTSSEPTELDLTNEFLSTVVGLDMSKYSLAPFPSHLQELNMKYDFKTVTELASIDFTAPNMDYISDEGELHVMVGFRYGHMTFVNIYNLISDSYIYSVPPAQSKLEQSLEMLERYKTYVSKVYGADDSFIIPMQSILNSISSLAPTNETIGNINFQVIKDEHSTYIKWVFVEDGVAVNRKRVEIDFWNDTFTSFTDTWSYYVASGVSSISSDEALKIARDAAQNVEIKIAYDEGKTETVKVPDLSNAPYDVSFSMIPYSGTSEASAGNMSRNSSTLYPYWQFHFLFNETIGGCIGVQVGVWGDTGEIVYASGYGLLGVSDISTGELPSSQTLQQGRSDNSEMLIIAVIIGFIAFLASTMVIVALRRRKKVSN